MAHSPTHEIHSCDLVIMASFLKLALSAINVMHKRQKLHCSQSALHFNIVVQFYGAQPPPLLKESSGYH